jgi:hypothetical protein
VQEHAGGNSIGARQASPVTYNVLQELGLLVPLLGRPVGLVSHHALNTQLLLAGLRNECATCRS